MAISHNYIKAGNDNLSAAESFLLAKDDSPHVRRRLAENPLTPMEVLIRLADDADQEVRIAVGCNAATPTHVLEKLANDDSIHVRFGLAGDPNLLPSVLNVLAQDDNPYVMHQALKTLEGIALENMLQEAGFVQEPGETERLGELLVAAGLIDHKQLDHFLLIARKTERPLGRVLVQSKILPRATIVAALNCQLMIRRNRVPVQNAIEELKETAKRTMPRCSLGAND
jgi:hypothetical protein